MFYNGKFIDSIIYNNVVELSKSYNIIKLALHDDNDILQLITSDNYKIDYYENKIIFDNNTLKQNVDMMVQIINYVDNELSKCIVACVLHKMLFDNPTFLQKESFRKILLNIKNNYDNFELIKGITNKNPVDIWLEKIELY